MECARATFTSKLEGNGLLKYCTGLMCISCCSTPTVRPSPKKRRRRVAYLGDITPGKFKAPLSAARAFQVLQKSKKKGRDARRNMTRRLRRATKKIIDLKSLLKHLTERNSLPLDLAKMIEVGIKMKSVNKNNKKLC